MKTKVFHTTLIIAGLCAALVLAGCSKKASSKARSAASGGPRGKIVIYTSMYEDIIEAVDKALAKVFPNCDIEFFYGGTGALQAKIAAERDAGKLGADMLMISEPSYALELKEYDMLYPYKSPEAAKLDFAYDPDGYWYPVRICNMVLAFNPEKFSRADLPQSLYDFAYDPRVKGAVSMGNPLTSGTTMSAVTALKDTYGYGYFTALGNQGVMVESGSVALTKLQTGECKQVMILEESILKVREEDGSQLEVIYPADGTVIIPSIIATLTDQWSANKNTKAAEAITDWFLSTEGQDSIVKGWMHSVRADYPNPPYDSIPTAKIKANSMPVNWENCYRQREEIRTNFQQEVTTKK